MFLFVQIINEVFVGVQLKQNCSMEEHFSPFNMVKT